ncbi:MAG TPA: universal stress protein [Bryobacteraceae bacterium]|nr:universal stress protein [Bryobacteraceae bacterium]
MQRFNNILLVMDNEARSGHASEGGLALARRNHARMTVATVMEALPREMRMLVPSIGLRDLLDLAVQEQRARLELLVEPARRESRLAHPGSGAQEAHRRYRHGYRLPCRDCRAAHREHGGEGSPPVELLGFGGQA